MITDISVDYQMFAVSHNKNIINSKVKVEHNKNTRIYAYYILEEGTGWLKALGSWIT